MKKQLRQAGTIIKMAWIRNLNYRFTTYMYRIGETAEVLVLVLMWTAIYTSNPDAIRGFTLQEMLTYVLMGNLFSAFVRNFLSSYIARDIVDGKLSMFLVKPIPYIKYVLLNELGRASYAIFASAFSQLIIIAFFVNKIIFNTDVRTIVLIIGIIILAAIIEALIGLLIGFLAFWSDEIDAVQSTVDRIKKFFSGGYFPLSLLPTSLITVSLYLPFAYSFFVPAQLYLQKISLREGVIGLGVQLIWIVILSIIVKIVWSKGLRRYEASGS